MNFFKKFRKNEDGIVSVEFALIAPMLIFGTLIAINLGYQVNKHQKLASSVSAGVSYLQDYTMDVDLDSVRPNWDSNTNTQSDSTPLATAKLVIRDAYGGNLLVDEIFLNTYCACPNNKVPDDSTTEDGLEPTTTNEKDFDFTDPDKDFYTRTNMSLWKKGEICAFNCPAQGGRARVLMDVEVFHVMTDLFGKQIVVTEKLKTRLR